MNEDAKLKLEIVFDAIDEVYELEGSEDFQMDAGVLVGKQGLNGDQFKSVIKKIKNSAYGVQINLVEEVYPYWWNDVYEVKITSKSLYKRARKYFSSDEDKISPKRVVENVDDSYNSPKFPYKLPSGIEWTSVVMRFQTNENVLIKVLQYEYATNYEAMGFRDCRNRGIAKTNEQWTFLQVLAKKEGEITIKDKEAKGKYKKQKELLTKKLKSYFSIDYDPFYPYHSSANGKEGNSYRIKIILIPPPYVEEKIVESKKNKKILF